MKSTTSYQWKPLALGVGAGILIAFIIKGLFSTSAPTQNSSGEKKASYWLGYQEGKRFRTERVWIDSDDYSRGLRDGFNGEPIPLSAGELQSELRRYVDNRSQDESKFAKLNEDSTSRFLNSNGRRFAVKKLENGTQYEILEAGATDSVTVGPNSRLMIRLEISTIDGAVLDRNVDGMRTQLQQLPEAMRPALLGMHLQERRKIYYRKNVGKGTDQVLVADIRVMSIE